MRASSRTKPEKFAIDLDVPEDIGDPRARTGFVIDRLSYVLMAQMAAVLLYAGMLHVQ